MQNRTAVLIHGCHLQAIMNDQAWSDIVWGCTEEGTPTLHGRATMGIKVALDNDAKFIIFSTGASERDGVKEGEYTRQHALAFVKTDRLAEVLGWQDVSDLLEQYLEDHSEVDVESQNTAEECARNLRLCAERGIDRVILVSSPWHIQRCHTEALKVAEEMRSRGETVPAIMTAASHGSSEGIVILEPPHRGDRPRTIWHQLARRFFRIPEARQHSFEHEQDELLTSYGA